MGLMGAWCVVHPALVHHPSLSPVRPSQAAPIPGSRTAGPRGPRVSEAPRPALCFAHSAALPSESPVPLCVTPWLGAQLLLAWCVKLSDSSVSQLAANCPLLDVLSIRGCARVTDAAVIKLAQVVPPPAPPPPATRMRTAAMRTHGGRGRRK